MFRKNTTFVIGAGASAEFGLPVGSQLAKLIRVRAGCTYRVNGPPTHDDLLTRLLDKRFGSERRPELTRALDIISQGISTAVSIDAFIDRFRDHEFIPILGKLLIALEIADAERGSVMHPNQVAMQDIEIAEDVAGDRWIGSFTRILLDGVSDPDEVGRGVALICFNYDRCIEYYLRDAIQAAYAITVERAQEIVSRLNIIHPYGTLGELETAANANARDVLAFGENLEEDVDWFAVAENNIRTYTEQQHEPNMIRNIHDAIIDASNLVFLGFGFNNQNLDILRVANLPEVRELDPKNIFASGFGIAREVDQTMRRRIMHLLWENPIRHKLYGDKVHIEYGRTCSQLFETHYMNLSSFTRSYFADGADGIVRHMAGSSLDG